MNRNLLAVCSILIFTVTACVKFTNPTTNPTATPVATLSAGQNGNSTSTPLVPRPSDTPNIPAPVGTPPWTTACNLPASTGLCNHSTPGGASGRGINSMVRVMGEVFAKHPEFFELKGTWACQYKLKKAYTDAYYQAWLAQIELDFEGDVCAQWDGEQLNVKYTNDFSESYHPIRFDGDFPPTQCLSDKDGIYMYSCIPAGF